MSTRRAGVFHFDHGAQYFTARSTAFRAELRVPLAQNIVQRWPGRHIRLSINEMGRRVVLGSEEPGGLHLAGDMECDSDVLRYVAAPAMNSLAKYLAQGLSVFSQTRVADINVVGSANAEGSSGPQQWSLRDEKQQALGDYDWVVITTPPEQAAQLLPPCYAYSDIINRLEMDPCLALMLGFTEPLSLDFDSATVKDADIVWIANNGSKPGRPPKDSLVIHATQTWSGAHLEASDDAILAHILPQVCELTGSACDKADHVAVHRWRYARASIGKKDTVFVDASSRLAVAGDWCLGPRVECAYLSGLMTAEAILSEITS
jgi:predicted NAD/FAD-dependent oxidoreductase